MQLSYDALNILLFLCPGLLASTLIRLLVYRRETGVFEKIVTALLWSLAIYGLCAFVGREAAVQFSETRRGDTILRGVSYNPAAIGWMFGFSVVLALLASIALNHDLLGKLLRWARITTQSGRATIWLDIFSEYRKFVVVHLSDERRVFGWILHFSNSGDDGYIYLYEPKWINEENAYVPTNSHGIFFIKSGLIDFVEFLDSPTSAADNSGKTYKPSKPDGLFDAPSSLPAAPADSSQG